jgi:hypothetical protein
MKHAGLSGEVRQSVLGVGDVAGFAELASLVTTVRLAKPSLPWAERLFST